MPNQGKLFARTQNRNTISEVHNGVDEVATLSAARSVSVRGRANSARLTSDHLLFLETLINIMAKYIHLSFICCVLCNCVASSFDGRRRCSKKTCACG